MRVRVTRVLGIVVMGVCARGFADGAATQPVGDATAPAATAPAAGGGGADKWGYTLFNPVPKDQMRGMSTDRPNVTNAPTTVDAGHLQIEMGAVDYQYFRENDSGGNVRSDTWGLGQFNFRLGVLNNTELNVVVNSYENVKVQDVAAGTTSRASGFGDTVVGGKVNVWGNEMGDDAWETAFAVQPQVKLGTAPKGVGNGRVEYAVGFPFLVNLPGAFHLSLQPGFSFERNTADTGYVAGVQGAVCVDRVVVGKLDAYVEYAGSATREAHTEAQQTIDVGVVYPVTDDVSLDTGLMFGVDKVSPTVELVAGVSVRF
jgi:Putative MetA-pathway of phenol degradation